MARAAPAPQAGLRGINLSGGQRQRLNLARCAYFGGDLVLLDNALSAVDHHTAQHIFQYCVKDMFRDKATVLVTHQIEFLPQCDKVAIMDDGKCLYFGPWNKGAAELLSRYLPASHLLAAAGNAEQPREAKKKAEKKVEEKDILLHLVEEKKDKVPGSSLAQWLDCLRLLWDCHVPLGCHDAWLLACCMGMHTMHSCMVLLPCRAGSLSPGMP